MEDRPVNSSRQERIQYLVDTLNKASEAYYNGSEIMSNKQYDALEAELHELEKEVGVTLPNSPSVNVGAQAVDSLPKFTHTYPARSLDKTKDMREFISKFQKGIVDSGSDNNKVVVMWKEDGSTVQAYYKGGNLDKLVTRGNGEVGNIITHNANLLAGLPLQIPFGGELIVRGEALMSYEEFNRINETLPVESKYKNPRNLAAATLEILDNSKASDRHLQFKAFNLVYLSCDDPRANTFSGRLDILAGQHFDVVEHITCIIDELEETMNSFSNIVEKYPYPVDGLVAALDNSEYASKLEGTEHHPHVMNGYAFKWSDETAETVLREIEWSPSRTGLLNPVAIFDPVELEGTTVTRASLHNLDYIVSKKLVIGDTISVYKANKIIPQIYQNITFDSIEGDKIEAMTERGDKIVAQMPTVCPTCGHELVITSVDKAQVLMCPNKECPEKLIGNLAHFCERDSMDIQGMSEETIQKLVDAKFISNYTDFFKLDDKLGIAFLPGFGKQSYNKLCEAAKKAKNTDFVHFFTALSIPNIGKGQLKALKQFLTTNYDELAERYGLNKEVFNLPILLSTLGCNGYNFASIDGFGDILAHTLTKWINERFNPAQLTPELELLGYVTFSDVRPTSNVALSSSISGKSFCITGKLIHHSNREELVSKIEAAGGKWVDSVSSKTDYLINNDVTSTSGKNKKAQELNIPIISEDDFLKML